MGNRLKNSIILMGIDWSQAAKTKAFKDIKRQSPDIAKIIKDLDSMFAKKIWLTGGNLLSILRE